MPDPYVPGDPITSWLGRNAIPIRHLEAGSGFADLQPLKTVWRDARVIGLGESTHGTREFFQIKHRLLEFLVTRMGFTVFAMEASHTACEPVNNYVQGGDGDVEALLSGMHYLAWHTEEFVALVEWLRDWNANAPDDRKVNFLGVDITYNERGREAVLAFLHRVAPDKIPDVECVFAILADGEAKWPLRIDDSTGARIQDILPTLDDLATWLDDNQSDLLARSSAHELDRIRFSLELMPQWWRGGPDGRTGFVGDNLVHLLDRYHPGARAVFWAHNGHVDAGTNPHGTPKAGHQLRRRFGDAYYACALEFGEGAYQYRHIAPDGSFGNLTTDTIGPPRVGSIPWYMAQTGVGTMLANLDNTPTHPTVGAWLATPLPGHALNWASPAPQSTIGEYKDLTPGSSFDGILYVERSTPVRPTTTALGHDARGELM